MAVAPMTSSRPRSNAPVLSRSIVQATRAPAGPRSRMRVAVVPWTTAAVTPLAAASTPPPSAVRATPPAPPTRRSTPTSEDSQTIAAGIARPRATASCRRSWAPGVGCGRRPAAEARMHDQREEGGAGQSGHADRQRRGGARGPPALRSGAATGGDLGAQRGRPFGTMTAARRAVPGIRLPPRIPSGIGSCAHDAGRNYGSTASRPASARSTACAERRVCGQRERRRRSHRRST